MRWDWQIGRVTPLQRTGASAVDIYDIDGFLTTRARGRQLHDSWQASHARAPEGGLLPRPGVGGLPAGRQPVAARQVLPCRCARKDLLRLPAGTLGGFPAAQRAQADAERAPRVCARKGFDAVELDDIDNFDPASTTGFHITPGDAQNFLAYALNLVHRYGMTVLWKNAPAWPGGA